MLLKQPTTGIRKWHIPTMSNKREINEYHDVVGVDVNVYEHDTSYVQDDHFHHETYGWFSTERLNSTIFQSLTEFSFSF